MPAGASSVFVEILPKTPYIGLAWNLKVCGRIPAMKAVYPALIKKEELMKNTLITIISVAALTFGAGSASAAGGVKLGLLKCHADRGIGWIVGSSKDVDCVFSPAGGGHDEYYTGSIGKLGLDIGITQETMLGWVVFAPGKLKSGSLKGSYTGAGVEATAGLGLGANVLVGGFRKSVNLQPISLQAQTGLNVAAGVSSLHLRRHHVSK
jgi:hypothetical protein